MDYLGIQSYGLMSSLKVLCRLIERLLLILTIYKKNPISLVSLISGTVTRLSSGFKKTNDLFVVNQTSLINFPGNEALLLPGSKAKIVLSIANGTEEAFDLFSFPLLAYYYEGAIYAVERSNRLEEIPNFYLDLFPTNCGILLYSPLWYLPFFSSYIVMMGKAYLTSFIGYAVQGDILTLRDKARIYRKSLL